MRNVIYVQQTVDFIHKRLKNYTQKYASQMLKIPFLKTWTFFT